MLRNCNRFLPNRAIWAAYFKHNVSPTSSAPNFLKISAESAYSCSVTANVAQKDKFQDLIDELVEQNPATNVANHLNDGFSKNLKTIMTVQALKSAISDARPSCVDEVLQVLTKLDNLAKFGQRKEATEYLTSAECTSMLYAQLLSTDADLYNLLESTIIIFKLYDRLPTVDVKVTEVDSLSLTPKFEEFYSALFDKIMKRLEKADLSAFPAEMIISLYCKLMNMKGELSKEIQLMMDIQILRKVPEVQLPSTIVSLLKSLKKHHFSNLTFIQPVFNKLEELVPVMLLGELVNVISTLAVNQCRPHELLQIVAEGIRNHTEMMIPGQLVRLGNALRDLSFYYPRLITRYCNDFTTNINKFTEVEQITSVISMLAKGKVTDEKAWKEACLWITKNYKKASQTDLRFCIGAFAFANVDPQFVKPFTKPFADSLKPRENESPKKWLTLVWSLAVLESLTPKLADSVLKETFEKALFNEITNEDEKVFNLQKLYQVNAAAKYDLTGYRGVLKTGDDQCFALDTCKKLKYGKSLSQNQTFLDNIYMSVTPDCRAAPVFHPETGTFIDVLTAFDQENKKFVPVSTVPKNHQKPLEGYTAVVYFVNQFTRMYSTEDANSRRLLGQFQMNIRHLQKAGAKVCVIAEHDLQKCGDIIKRVIYMKEQIAKPKETYYHAPNWSEPN